MPDFLTMSSVMMCPHGGMVMPVTSNTRVKAAGDLILRLSDTYLIVGCPFNLVVPHPCVQVQWIVTCMENQVMQDLPLNESSVGLCIAPDGVPQGVVLIVFTQPLASGL